MSTYGYEIVQTLIVDIEPDERVKKAMNDINAGKEIIVLPLWSDPLSMDRPRYFSQVQWYNNENDYTY